MCLRRINVQSGLFHKFPCAPLSWSLEAQGEYGLFGLGVLDDIDFSRWQLHADAPLAVSRVITCYLGRRPELANDDGGQADQFAVVAYGETLSPEGIQWDEDVLLVSTLSVTLYTVLTTPLDYGKRPCNLRHGYIGMASTWNIPSWYTGRRSAYKARPSVRCYQKIALTFLCPPD